MVINYLLFSDQMYQAVFYTTMTIITQ